MDIMREGFETRRINIQPMWLVMFQAPDGDLDRTFDAIAEVAPLKQGNTDRNGYRAPAGIEYCRPREGTPAGAEEDTRRRPCVDEMRYFLPPDAELLNAVIEVI